MIRTRQGRLFFMACCLLLSVGVVLFALALGSAEIPASETLAIVAHTLRGPFASDTPSWPSWAENIVWNLRMPRIALAGLVGAALSLSGAALQGMFRNPLACPSVLGVSAGASLGAVVAIYLGLAVFWAWSIPICALLGGAGVAFAVYAIAARRGPTSTSALLLAGIAFSGFASALSAFFLSLTISRWKVASTILFWTLGGLEGRAWDHVILATPFIVIGAAIIFAHARDLDALLLGEVHAASVGTDVVQVRKRLILAAAMLTAAAVSVAGSIGFIGLIIPHILRLILGPQHRWLLPSTCVCGAIFLIGVDLIIRVCFVHEQLPIGVVTAALGAPFFLFLLLRSSAIQEPAQ